MGSLCKKPWLREVPPYCNFTWENPQPWQSIFRIMAMRSHKTAHNIRNKGPRDSSGFSLVYSLVTDVRKSIKYSTSPISIQQKLSWEAELSLLFLNYLQSYIVHVLIQLHYMPVRNSYLSIDNYNPFISRYALQVAVVKQPEEEIASCSKTNKNQQHQQSNNKKTTSCIYISTLPLDFKFL